jgi:NADP-dependent aldehyde dehydrogenase
MSVTSIPSSVSDLEAALAAATAARSAVGAASDEDRARWLDAIAEGLTAAADELVPVAHRESHLPIPRLQGEVVRTAFQASLFARRLRERTLFDVRVDHADPAWPMGARPDIRLGVRPIGVVLVFAASNFPFAFSVAGGDSVSAIAAGCPVVVKAHEGHPELSRMVAGIVVEAMRSAGAPDGAFALVEGKEAGAAAVVDPRVSAVGFTGSVHGGRALFDLAVGRPDPIPFHGELGSTNPVVVTPAAWATRSAEVATGFAGSFTLGTGQFCTKPGILFVPDSAAFVDAVAAAVDTPVGPMLGDRIRDGFESAVGALSDEDGVRLLWQGEPNDESVRPMLLGTTIDDVIARPELLEQECFGPAALVVEYDGIDRVVEALGGVHGSLTGTVQAGSDDDPDAPAVVAALADRVGRVIWNGWPTGVTVTDAQQHGGPWPATTAPNGTSVGMAAAARWARPVAYQGVPDAVLPVLLRDGETVPGRRVDGTPQA